MLALGLATAMCQGAGAQGPLSTPEPPAVSRECGEAAIGTTPLPNSALALQKRGQVRILAIGAFSAAMLGFGHDGKPPLLEPILEHHIKGLDGEIIHRGFCGELGEAAGGRL